MFSNNNISKNVHQTGSRKSSLQVREHEVSFPPSKKPRPAEKYTSRQTGVEDDIWGDDLDANSVEECFLLASQALSQVCMTNEMWQLPSSLPQFIDSISACEFFLLSCLLFLTVQAEGVGVLCRLFFLVLCAEILTLQPYIFLCFVYKPFSFTFYICTCKRER
jgi:hypothetical protein